jgi:glycosyltransferase involved in cell wall biosynthesis
MTTCISSSTTTETAVADSSRLEGPCVRVVVPAHNAAAFLGETLQSLVDQEGAPRFRVVVVVSASVDDTERVAQSFADRLDLVVAHTSVPGGNVARNHGAQMAGDERYLLFLDHDDVAEPTWVRNLVGALATLDVALGRYALDRLNSKATRDLRGPAPFVEVPETWERSMLRGQGGNCGWRKTAWDEVGGLDETHNFVDDVEILWRADDCGKRIGYVADATIQYRLRPTPMGYFMQYVHRYEGWAHLHAQFPDRVPRRTVFQFTKQVAWLVVHLPRAFSSDPARKGSWIAPAARVTGSLRGSLKHRTVYL